MVLVAVEFSTVIRVETYDEGNSNAHVLKDVVVKLNI